MEDQDLYIIVLTKCFQDIYLDLKNLGGEILVAYQNYIYSSFYLDKKKSDILTQNFADEINEMNKLLLNELFEIIKAQNHKIQKSLDNTNTDYNYTIINIIKNCFPNEVLFNGIFKKSQESKKYLIKLILAYINQLFETQNKRITQSLEFETWESTIVPDKFKKIVDFILTADFKILKECNINKILEEFNTLEDYSNDILSEKELLTVKKAQSSYIPTLTNKIDKKEDNTNQNIVEDKKSNQEYLITINDSQFKLIISMFDVILLIFKSFKMFCLFDNVLHESILNKVSLLLFIIFPLKLSKVIRNTCSMSNEMIINQKAVSNKSIQKMTNEEVSKFFQLM